MAKSGKMSSSRKKPANIVKGDVSEIKEEENNFEGLTDNLMSTEATEEVVASTQVILVAAPQSKVVVSTGAVEDDMAEVKDAPVKRKAEADDETLPVKKTKLINNGFCLFVGNLNASKTIEEIKSALANLFTSHGLLFQDIRVDSKKKFAYVDFQSEEDLVKALEMNEELILGQKMRLDKAKVKESAKDKKIAKDARTLFIKNIPFAATKEDLMNVFDTAVEIRFPGGIGSPSKGIAYIEFKTEAHAEKVLEEKQGTDIQGRIVVIDFLGEKSRNKKINKVPAEIPPNNKLLVTNLAYAAKEDTLKEVFLKAVSVNIPKSKGKSRGHAVIQFDSVEDATEALDSALNQEICGRVIRVEFSQDRSTKKSHQIATGPSKTLMVQNLAKETREETLRSAFEGAVKARITKDKETGESRGFGFVEFESSEVCRDVKEVMEDLEIDGSKVTLVFAKPKGEQGPGGEGAASNKSVRGKPRGRGGARGRGQAGGLRGGRGRSGRGRKP
ncbi:nucleolin isoform X4 [Esox lucius]|uniref:RRM domain-containing protein n=1 Tax=Esox lucius TaxID=8010 RepID=A0A3P8Z664_ESOLU|nr:nucleolin isoform X4 [Esox lucius]